MLSYLCPISSDATCLHDIQNSTWYQRYIGLPGPSSYPSLPISAFRHHFHHRCLPIPTTIFLPLAAVEV